MMSAAAQFPKALAEPASKVCAFDKASVYLLDDDLSMLKALDRLLKSDGFNVEKFNQPGGLSFQLRANTLSRGNPRRLDAGYERIGSAGGSSQRSAGTRIIFISGRDDPSVRQAALDAGAFGFLSKPFDDETLLQLVRKAVAA